MGKPLQRENSVLCFPPNLDDHLFHRLGLVNGQARHVSILRKEDSEKPGTHQDALPLPLQLE